MANDGPAEPTLAQIAAQVAQLNQQLTEERLLRQQAEARLAMIENGQAFAATQQATAQTLQVPQPNPPTTIMTEAPRAPKVATPDRFDGTRGMKAEVYLSQVGLYILTNTAMFPNDQSKVSFALSYLTGGAAQWAQPWIQRVLKPTEGQQAVTYDNFVREFEAIFYDTDRKARAERDIRKLKQTRSAAEYTMKFNMLAPATGWEVPTLISHYRQGLQRDIRVLMVRDEFTTLPEITTLATKIDNDLHGERFEAPSTSTHAPEASTSNDPDAMDLSAAEFNLSREEVARRRANGLCYKCGGKGHIARKCKGKKKGSWKGKVAEIEGEEDEKAESKSEADKSKNGDARA